MERGYITQDVIAETIRRTRVGQEIELKERFRDNMVSGKFTYRIMKGRVAGKYPHHCRIETVENKTTFSRCILWRDLIGEV